MRPSVEERFWALVDKSGDCWEWKSLKGTGVYAKFYLDGRYWPAHRFSYTLHHGEEPIGLVIDHLCRNPPCVNPAHLEAVTHAENTRRGESAQRARERGLARTACPAGHELTEENTYRSPSDGARQCRTCRAERGKVGNAKRHQAGNQCQLCGASPAAGRAFINCARYCKPVCYEQALYAKRLTMRPPTGPDNLLSILEETT